MTRRIFDLEVLEKKLPLGMLFGRYTLWGATVSAPFGTLSSGY
jgi:hypothetical protein